MSLDEHRKISENRVEDLELRRLLHAEVHLQAA
jgi:hypothetical protein